MYVSPSSSLAAALVMTRTTRRVGAKRAAGGRATTPLGTTERLIWSTRAAGVTNRIAVAPARYPTRAVLERALASQVVADVFARRTVAIASRGDQ